MGQDSIPDDLKPFIWRSIDRLETLEALLLLAADSQRSWSPTELHTEMRSSPLAVDMALRQLVEQGLVREQAGTFRYAPVTSDLDSQTRRLSACYRDKRTAVITVVYSRPPDAIRSFADAFRLKKGSD